MCAPVKRLHLFYRADKYHAASTLRFRYQHLLFLVLVKVANVDCSGLGLIELSKCLPAMNHHVARVQQQCARIFILPLQLRKTETLHIYMITTSLPARNSNIITSLILLNHNKDYENLEPIECRRQISNHANIGLGRIEIHHNKIKYVIYISIYAYSEF